MEDQGIPAKYLELDCNHEFGCVLSGVKDDLIDFISKNSNDSHSNFFGTPQIILKGLSPLFR
jgi:hypothetical protein